MARRSRRRGLDPEDVLSGRVTVDVHQLVALIHEVNPTGRGLGKRDEIRAYEIKSRLQSLLVRRFEEHLDVDEQADGVIAFSLRATGQPAAHCPIDALDEDARARVRYLLDVRASPEPRPSRGASAGSLPANVGDPVSRARAALDAWDLEAAKAILMGAHAASPSDVVTAYMLVELLVDSLGDAPGALALFERFEPSLRRDPRVAGVVAVAAARMGEVARSRELLGGWRGSRATEAWAELARVAIARDDDALAKEARESLAGASPPHPRLHELDDYLDARRALALERAEARLLEAEERGAPVDDLVAMARAVLGDHSRSAVAARILRAREEAAVRERVEALLRAADTREEDDPAAAAAAWREALALGADPQGVTERLRAAEARVRSERVAAVTDEIARELGSSLEAGLARALRADADVAAALRARLAPEHVEALARAEEIARASPGARPKAVARAAAALELAARSMEQGDAIGAGLQLDAHASLLDPLPEVAALRARVRAAHEEALRAQDIAALDAAREALERGDLARARQSLARARGAGLDPELRQRRDELAARLDTLERRVSLDATLDAREGEGAWLAVAAACDAELERIRGESDAMERAVALSARARRMRGRAQEEHRWAVLPLGGADAPLPPLGRGGPLTLPQTARAADGGLLAVTGGAGWIIVRWMDEREGAASRVVCFRVPGELPIAQPTSARASGERLSIATTLGGVYALDLSDGSLLGHVKLETESFNPNPVLLVSDSEFAWQLAYDELAAGVYDTRTGGLRRSVPGAGTLAPVEHAPLVARSSLDGEGYFADVFDARGAKVGRRAAVPGPVLRCCLAQGRVYAICDHALDDEGPSHSIVELDVEAGASTPRVPIDAPDAADVTFTVERDGAYVVQVHGTWMRVEAHRLADPPERCWQLQLEHACLGAPGLGSVPLFVPGPGGQRVVHVSLAAPQLEDDRAPPAWSGVTVRGAIPLDGPAAARARERARFAADPSYLAALPEIAHHVYARGGDADVVAESLAVLWLASARTFPDAVEMLCEGEHATPALRAWAVQDAMDRGAWSEARELLDEIEPALRVDGPPALASWCGYARGVLLYATGEVRRAIATWEALGGMDAATGRAAAFAEESRRLHEGATSSASDATAVLLRAIRESDARASAGDRRGAMAALDRHEVWAANEPQSFSRLAALHLEHEPATAAEWLRKLEVFAELVLRRVERYGLVLAVPGAHWPEERIDEIHDRAVGWLAGARPPAEHLAGSG